MPGKFNGRQLAERLRAAKPGLKVVITSGYNTEMPALDQEFATGAIVYLPKPCEPAILLQVFQKCLPSPPQRLPQ